MSPNHIPLSATLNIMVLSSQTLEFVTKIIFTVLARKNHLVW